MRRVSRPACPAFMIPYLSEEQPREDARKHIEGRNLRDDGRGSGLPSLLGQELRQQLGYVFLNKCCYCESQLVGGADIDQFRPKSVYRRLAWDWRNLYLACPICNRSKGGRFPLADGSHAHPSGDYETVIMREIPLLLDPCADDPAEHLAFFDDGQVAGLTERGKTTVQVLALNRPLLVDARRKQITIAVQQGAPSHLADDMPYFEAVRQCLYANNDLRVPGFRQDALPAQQRHDAARSAVNTESDEGLDQYDTIARYVSRLRIENFGPIRLLDLDMSAPNSSEGPCFAILGENGVGKSTVLRALALTLSGSNYAQRLKLKSRAFLPKNAYEGEVRVTIPGQPDVVMKLRRNKAIEFSATASSSLVLAYGATRLLPKGRRKPKEGFPHAKIDNLFDPFLPMTNPSSWLSKIDDSRLVDVNEVLNKLLPQDHLVQLSRATNSTNIVVTVGGQAERTIAQLSDGYQSLIGMAVDIMEVLYRAYTSMKDAQGIVLIDELGNHFHPAWRLRCLSALREAFPSIQFIFSTHDPLCLRGLKAGEVAVLKRDKLGQIYALDDLPPVEKLRVEQLLMSEHFGLNSTLDPQMEDDVQRYKLLSEQGARTEAEEGLLHELTQKLTDSKYLGTTRRERLALQLVDHEGDLAIPTSSTVHATALAQSTVQRLRRLMSEMAPTQAPNP